MNWKKYHEEKIEEIKEKYREKYNIKKYIECHHEHVVLTKRIIKSGSKIFVMQCTDCGKNKGAISKKKLTEHDIVNAKEWDYTFENEREYHNYTLPPECYEEIANLWSLIYYQYLESNEWKQKRNRILSKALYLCQGCKNNKANRVHHMTYRNLGDESDEELMALCDTCHDSYHRISRVSNKVSGLHDPTECLACMIKQRGNNAT